jgi:hypothetical protein
MHEKNRFTDTVPGRTAVSHRVQNALSDFEGILSAIARVDITPSNAGAGPLRQLPALSRGGPVGTPAKIRKAVPNTQLQMCLGQNLLGYKPYPDAS